MSKVKWTWHGQVLEIPEMHAKFG